MGVIALEATPTTTGPRVRPYPHILRTRATPIIPCVEFFMLEVATSLAKGEFIRRKSDCVISLFFFYLLLN
jgi:hypothetical protein